mmetsp:Transcript_14194/g.15384  ORF Transcript_14194/g.15384 Transcript_14194/m.15384 type:complete len:275 (+) Transcript_14194:35-859(+)
MSVDVVKSVNYSRKHDLKFYYSELRKSISELQGAAVQRPFIHYSYYEVNNSKDFAVKTLQSGVQKRIDEYHTKRLKVYDVFIGSNPYITPCNKGVYSCRNVGSSTENFCAAACCFQCYICCFPVVTVMCCPYNCCLRGCTNEKQWLEATMVANPDLDGAVLDAALVRSLEEYRDQLNQQSTTRMYDFSFRKNYRFEYSGDSEGTVIEYVDQILFTIMNRPPGFVYPSQQATPPASVLLHPAYAPIPVTHSGGSLILDQGTVPELAVAELIQDEH